MKNFRCGLFLLKSLFRIGWVLNISKFSVLHSIIFCSIVLHMAAVIYSSRRDSHRQNFRLPSVCPQR